MIASRGGFGGVVALVALTAATPAHAGAWASSLSLELGASGAIYFSGDAVDYYGGDKLEKSGFGGAGLGVGLFTPVSSHFDVGIRGEYSTKRYDVDVNRPSSKNLYFIDHWEADFLAVEAAVQARYPMDTRRVRMTWVLGASAGVCTLVGATYSNTLVPGSVDLSGTGLGVAIEGGIDLFGGASTPVSVLLGLRFASVSPVQASGSLAGSPVSGDLVNDDGSAASMNHDGMTLRISARLPVWRRK